MVKSQTKDKKKTLSTDSMKKKKSRKLKNLLKKVYKHQFSIDMLTPTEHVEDYIGVDTKNHKVTPLKLVKSEIEFIKSKLPESAKPLIRKELSLNQPSVDVFVPVIERFIVEEIINLDNEENKDLYSLLIKLNKYKIYLYKYLEKIILTHKKPRLKPIKLNKKDIKYIKSQYNKLYLTQSSSEPLKIMPSTYLGIDNTIILMNNIRKKLFNIYIKEYLTK